MDEHRQNCRCGLLTSRLLLLLVMAIMMMCSVWAQDDDSYVKDGKLAKAFCASPAFKSLTCGFASQKEQQATIQNQCPLCGTVFTVVPHPLPANLSGNPNYFQYASDVASLACSGPVVVRAVLKILEQPPISSDLAATLVGTSCTNAGLVWVDDKPISKGGNATEVVRCALQLPAGQDSEEQRALRAKEVNCTICNLCGEGGGCLAALNTWYSDTFTTSLTGCNFDPAKGYVAHKFGINVNPGTTIRLAKFEVCSSPPCFDVAAEQAKLKGAKRCVKGKCG